MNLYNFLLAFGYYVPMTIMCGIALFVRVSKHEKAITDQLNEHPLWPVWLTGSRFLLLLAVIPLINLGAYQLTFGFLWDLIFPDKDSE